MELWDQVEVVDKAVAADWARLVIDRLHHRKTGGFSSVMSSSAAARQYSAPKVNEHSRGSV